MSSIASHARLVSYAGHVSPSVGAGTGVSKDSDTVALSTHAR